MSARDAWIRRAERLLCASIDVLEQRLADGDEATVSELTKSIAAVADLVTAHRALIPGDVPTPRKRKPRRKPGSDAQ